MSDRTQTLSVELERDDAEAVVAALDHYAEMHPRPYLGGVADKLHAALSQPEQGEAEETIDQRFKRVQRGLEGVIDSEVSGITAQRDAHRDRLGRIRAAAESDADLEGTPALRSFLLAETDLGVSHVAGYVPGEQGETPSLVLSDEVRQRLAYIASNAGLTLEDAEFLRDLASQERERATRLREKTAAPKGGEGRIEPNAAQPSHELDEEMRRASDALRDSDAR